MNLLQQQARNRRRTWMVMIVFVAFLFLLGYGFDLAYLGTPFPVVGLLALGVGTASAFAGYVRGDRAVLVLVRRGADRPGARRRVRPRTHA